MKNILLLFLVALFILPSISAVEITNTTFFANITNFTIFVNTITLDQVTVSNTTIQFFNLTSIGSQFTNTNATFNARADFIGLLANVTVRNIDTSTDLFTSQDSDRDFNATFSPGETIEIIDFVPSSIVGANSCRSLALEFGAYTVLIGLVGTIIFLGAVIFMLRGGFSGISLSIFQGNTLFGAILILISIAVLVIMSIVIIGALCVLF